MKKLFIIASTFLIYIYISIYITIPQTLTMIQGQEITYPFYDFIDINFDETSNIKAVGGNLISPNICREKATLSILGKIPLKKLNVNVVSSKLLVPGGDAIGLKLYTPGLTVITFEEITTRDYTKVKPYKDKNIQRGDLIVEINGKEIREVKDFVKEIQRSNGKEVELKYIRNNRTYKEKIKPEIDRNDGQYKLGMWVKNITSGVGTVTYIDKTTGMFGALGHGITDIDANNLLQIQDGDAYKAVILSVKEGKKGNPGELRGAIRQNSVYGKVIKNTRFGVFGYIDKKLEIPEKEYEIALKNEVKEGKAKILTTTKGQEIKEYEIEIEQINKNREIKEKGMIIKITDKELIEKTGGIVQGMSGSPIIQNGKLIGAVTHVLINDPKKGYGIFIENMLEASK